MNVQVATLLIVMIVGAGCAELDRTPSPPQSALIATLSQVQSPVPTLELTVSNPSGVDLQVRNVFEHPAYTYITICDESGKALATINPIVSAGMLPDKITIPKGGSETFTPRFLLDSENQQKAKYFYLEFALYEGARIRTNMIEYRR